MTVGQQCAERLAAALRSLGHESEAYSDYGRAAVGCHRVGKNTVGTWRHVMLFTDDGKLIPNAGGGRGNPWRYGAEHDAVEAAEAR